MKKINNIFPVVFFSFISLFLSSSLQAGNGKDIDTTSVGTLINCPDISTKVDTRRNRNHFQKKVHLISLGYGIPNYSGALFSYLKDKLNDFDQSGIGPIFLKYDYAFTDHISIGLTTRFSTNKLEYPVESVTYDGDGNSTAQDSTYTYGQQRMSIAGMARFNYHFGTSRRWDPYAGIGLGYGYNILSIDLGGDLGGDDSKVSSTSPIAMEITAGARFFITPKFAVYGEVGFSQSLANLGVSIKL